MRGFVTGIYIAVFLLGIYTEVCAADDPLLLWTQKSYKWSKIKGIKGDPQKWVSAAEYPTYVQSITTVHGFKFDIVYDHKTKHVYWNDNNYKKIYRQAYDDIFGRTEKNIVTVLEGTSENVTAISLDWTTGNLYYADAARRYIGVTAAHPSRTDIYKIIINDNIIAPSGLAVHPDKRWLFWTDSDRNKPAVKRATLLGKDQTTLVSRPDFRSPRGVTIDFNEQLLYFVDKDSDAVFQVDFNGNNFRRIIGRPFSDLRGFLDVAEYKDYLFVSGEGSLEIDVFDKRGTFKLTKEIDANPYGLEIIQNKPDGPENDCVKKGCKHLCLVDKDADSRCGCRQGYYLQLDGKSCESTKPRYIYSLGESVWIADVTIPEHLPKQLQLEQKMLVGEMQRVQALGYHFKLDLVYMADTMKDVIYAGNSDGQNTIDMTVETRHVEGISVDWLAKNVYWTDANLHHIMVSQFDGRYHKILIKDAKAPRGIAVDPVRSCIYWVSGENPSKLMKASMDGTDIKTLFTFPGGSPQGLAMDPREKLLFWTDMSSGEIYSINITSKTVTPKLAIRATKPYDVTVFQEYTTWTDKNAGLRFGMHSTGEMIYHHETKPAAMSTVDAYDVVSFSSYLQPDHAVTCLNNNGGCAQLCFPKEGGRQCGCAIGYVLDSDQKSCNSEHTDEHFVMYVDPYHKQIYQMKRTSHVTQGVPVPPMNRPISAYYDAAYNIIYWIDIGQKVIKRSNLDGSDAKDLMRIGSDSSPQRISVDPMKQMVYFTDSKKQGIFRMDTYGNGLQMIVSGLQNPHAIAVDYKREVIYWSERGSTPRISMSGLDGSNIAVLINSGLKNPSALAMNPGVDTIYYSDQELGTIQAYNVSTKLNKMIMTNSSMKINAVGVDTSHVYFATWSLKAVFRVKSDGKSMPELLDKPVFARITDMHVFMDKLPRPGLPFWIWIAAAGAALLLFLLLLCCICCFCCGACGRRKKKQDDATGGFDNPDMNNYYADIDHSHVNAETAVASDSNIYANAENGIVAEASSSNGAASRQMPSGAVPIIGAGVSGAGVPPPLLRKPKRYKKSAGRKQQAEGEPDTRFEMNEANVKTGILRAVNKLRNRLSSIRWSQDPSKPPEDNHTDIDGGDNLNAIGPERGRPDPNKRKIDIPLQTHKLPRGFSPASHTVPAGVVKQSWGRAKYNQFLGK